MSLQPAMWQAPPYDDELPVSLSRILAVGSGPFSPLDSFVSLPAAYIQAWERSCVALRT